MSIIPGRDFERLSEASRVALRLTFDRHMEAAEVARELDVPLETIRKRLARARHLLGAPSTKVAARLLAEHEGRLGQSRVHPPLAIPPEHIPKEIKAPAAVFQPPVWWRRPNELSASQRHLVMAAVFVALVVGFFLAAGFLQALTSFWSPARR